MRRKTLREKLQRKLKLLRTLPPERKMLWAAVFMCWLGWTVAYFMMTGVSHENETSAF